MLADRIVFVVFQAEDGIRDIGVTGVQTCALPIYRCRSYHSQLHGANGRRLLPAKAHDEQVGIGGRSTWRLPAYRSRRLRLDRKALWRKGQIWQLYLLFGRSLPPPQPLEGEVGRAHV